MKIDGTPYRTLWPSDDGEALDNLEWGITGRKPVR